MTHNVRLPIRFGEIPVLSLHSTIAPVIDVLAVATAVEFKAPSSISTVTSSKVNGPQGLVVIGGLWSMALVQLIGAPNDQLVTPVTKLTWLHFNEILSPE